MRVRRPGGLLVAVFLLCSCFLVYSDYINIRYDDILGNIAINFIRRTRRMYTTFYVLYRTRSTLIYIGR